MLAAEAVPWCVVGGWAVDLAVGTATRAHGDLEIAVPRSHLDVVLSALEDRGLRVEARGDFQHWVLDPDTDSYVVDVMAEPGDADEWVFRRDERVRLARDDAVALGRGRVPHLRPACVLLYKAKEPRRKDEADATSSSPSSIR